MTGQRNGECELLMPEFRNRRRPIPWSAWSRKPGAVRL